MREITRNVVPQIIAAYLLFTSLFAWFAYANWTRIDHGRWIDLGVVSALLFGFMVPALGQDLKRPKVFVVLAGLFTGHMAFCVHYLKMGIYVRPLLYAPIGIAEIAISTFALMTLGGATLDDFRDSLPRRDRK